MQTKFMISGSIVSIVQLNEDTALDFLPPKIYTVQYDQMVGFYLAITKDELELPPKIYGNTPNRVEKCISTYKQRNASTGILLTGDKGTGKTLLMSLLANKVISELNLPVILIKDAFAGSKFVSFIETIGECALVFDEFGKMYNSNDRHMNENDVPQTALLSLMDGVDKTKRLFVLTENSELDINEFMLNRPSRIYYHFKYKKLDESSITGYCEDNDVSKEIIKEIIELSRRTRIFSFDMLQAIVEEHLRFNSSIDELTLDLNIDTREEMNGMMEILKIIEKGTEEQREIFETPFIPKPNKYSYIRIKSKNVSKNVSKNPNDEKYDEVCIDMSDLAYELNGKSVYETEEYTIITKDVPMSNTNYFRLL